jgi:hypothetical protein
MSIAMFKSILCPACNSYVNIDPNWEGFRQFTATCLNCGATILGDVCRRCNGWGYRDLDRCDCHGGIELSSIRHSKPTPDAPKFL